MKAQARPPIWATLLGSLVWILLAANVVYDYVRDRRITPFSLVMFFALLVGSLVPRLLKIPSFPTPRGIVWLTYAMIFLVVIAWVVYTLIRVFL